MLGGDEVPNSPRSLGFTEAVELKIEVERAVSTLPPQLREMCHALMNMSVAELCRSHDLSRGKVSFQMKKIRRAFEHAGLGEYPQKKARQNQRVSIM